MALKVVILHGTKGTPSSNWFPWALKEIENAGLSCIAPTLPTPENQSLNSWINAFQNQCGELTENHILIGHSLGAVFMLRLLESSISKIKKSIFISGFTGKIGIKEYDDLNESFIDKPFNWNKIISNAGDIKCIYGENDPYVPQDQLKNLSDMLGINPIIIPNGKHLNKEAGFDMLPIILELIR